jgi:hypothetical protein
LHKADAVVLAVDVFATLTLIIMLLYVYFFPPYGGSILITTSGGGGTTNFSVPLAPFVLGGILVLICQLYFCYKVTRSESC